METKRRILDKDVQHLMRNAVSDESGKRVCISIVSGIREIKKIGEDFRESHICSSRNQTLHGDSEKMGTSEDEMDINTLNSCPAALCKPQKGLQLVTDKTEPYHIPFSFFLNFSPKSSSILAAS